MGDANPRIVLTALLLVAVATSSILSSPLTCLQSLSTLLETGCFDFLKLEVAIASRGLSLSGYNSHARVSGGCCLIFEEELSQMRNYFTSYFANSILLLSFVFLSGCQNELASTERVEPDRVSESIPAKARGLAVSEEIALDKIVSQELGSDDLRQVNWEEDISQDSKKIAPPNLDEVLNLESTELGKLTGDASETKSFRK